MRADQARHVYTRPAMAGFVDAILIMDRDAEFCRSLADGLTATGYVAVWTTEPRAAARLVAEQRFALLVVDETLPLPMVRIDPGLPILCVRSADGAQPVTRAPGLPVIEPPIDRHLLLAHVWTLAGSRRGLAS